jgi:hypothetical protein
MVAGLQESQRTSHGLEKIHCDARKEHAEKAIQTLIKRAAAEVVHHISGLFPALRCSLIGTGQNHPSAPLILKRRLLMRRFMLGCLATIGAVVVVIAIGPF